LIFILVLIALISNCLAHDLPDPKLIPGFSMDTPVEANLYNNDVLEKADPYANPYARDVREIAETRQYFVIDPEIDPMIKNSENAAKDPEAFLKGPIKNRKRTVTYDYKTCHESKPKTELKCQKSLLDLKINITPEKKTHFWCTSGKHGPDDHRCRAKKYYQSPIVYQQEQVNITSENWSNTCKALESRAACRLVKKTCPKGPETRTVTGMIGGKEVSRKVTKDCWRYEYVYECSHPSINNCEPLRHSGCEQMQSECAHKIGTECVEWKQSYRCPKEVIETTETLSDEGYSLPDNPKHAVSTPNKDMNEAIAKLSIFDQIQKEMRASPTVTSISVFKGKRQQCTIAFAGFKNCCLKDAGWGVSLNLAKCDAEDRQLAQQQKKKLCVEVGTYCSKKILGVCMRKKRSYCCFPNKLARIVHEQGRAQLGMNWGEAKNPMCRGFTTEELSRINFDKLNMTEIFAEIIARTKQVTAKVVKRNVTQRVKDMTNGLGNTNKGEA